ncbi:hypothetical protein J6590_051853 [Homalodisca vitripennis]|nr:hypothetical protein J6590_051853 [Homalodisca vitripennis]
MQYTKISPGGGAPTVSCTIVELAEFSPLILKVLVFYKIERLTEHNEGVSEFEIGANKLVWDEVAGVTVILPTLFPKLCHHLRAAVAQ